MIMDTLGALALATEPPNDALMKRPPIGRDVNFITRIMWRNIIGQSVYQLVVLGILQFDGKSILNINGPGSTDVLNTMIFNTFVFCQVFNEINSRDMEKINVLQGTFASTVAKENADVVIMDDNFKTIVVVARWGRSVYINIQKFVQFQLTVNVVALMTNFVSACTSGSAPLTAVQLLWVNMIMDTLGTFASTVPLSWSLWFASVLMGAISLPVGALLKCIPVKSSTDVGLFKQHDGYEPLPRGPDMA
nr:calcium-transporting ATPase 4, plasma membrane-type-like isoform X2 [Tanacetum cinerariifolium]